MTNPFESIDTQHGHTPISPQLIPIDQLKIPESFDQPVFPGVSLDSQAREVFLDKNNLAFVGINSAAYTFVLPETAGQIYTFGLASCTGVGGFAEIEDGRIIAGVSHFDPIVDARQRSNGICPSERFISTLINSARKRGAQSIKLFVLYDSLQKEDPKYGKFGDNYEDWHFLDQLESLADDPEEGIEISYEEYEGMGAGHTLSVNISPGAVPQIVHN